MINVLKHKNIGIYLNRVSKIRPFINNYNWMKQQRRLEKV